jgi:hypothetical protein
LGQKTIGSAEPRAASQADLETSGESMVRTGSTYVLMQTRGRQRKRSSLSTPGRSAFGRELETIYAQENADTPADLADEAVDAYWNALTRRELELSQQVATAPIASLEDAVTKLRLVRQIHRMVGDDAEDLAGYEGIAARCVRDALEWLEAMVGTKT